MSEYENPIPDPSTLPGYSDKDLLDVMRQLRTDRRDKGTAIARFTRAMHKAGYDISLSEYKKCEQYPAHGVEHIRAGMLEAAYSVLNSLRVQTSPQQRNTAHAMEVISRARIAHGLEYFEMAEKLDTRGVTITESEYRTIEQGMAKHATFELVAECARILGIAPGELFA